MNLPVLSFSVEACELLVVLDLLLKGLQMLPTLLGPEPTPLLRSLPIGYLFLRAPVEFTGHFVP